MSRCFPYPPPGYVGKCASNEALILSIKKGKDKAKTDRKKDRKQEKREKREKKENATANGLEKQLLSASGEMNLYKHQKHVKWPEDGCNQSKLDASSEHFENSCVTEEYGKPCSSLDSTENSDKRKRHALTQSHSNQVVGTVIRFRLSSQKRGEPSSSLNTVPVCSSSGRANPIQERGDLTLKGLNQVISGPTALATCSASLPLDPASSVKVQLGSTKEHPSHTGTSSPDGKKKAPKAVRKYKKLFETWAPPPPEDLLMEDLDDDQGWLFGGREEAGNVVKRLKFCKEEVFPGYGGSSTLQPSAHHLSDVDIYALPFTVPF